MFKRIMALVFNILLITSLISCKSTSSSNISMIYNVDGIEEIWDFVSDSKGQIFIASEGKILVFDTNGSRKDSIEIQDYYVTNLFIENNEIVVLDIFHNKIFTMSTKGEILKEKSYGFQFIEISKMRKIGDLLFIIGIESGEDNMQQSKVLLKYDLSSNNEYVIPIDDVNNFTVYEKDTLLLQIGRSCSKFIVFDIKSDTVGEEVTFKNSIIEVDAISDFEYDSSTNKLFFIANKQLLSVKPKKADSEELLDKLHNFSYKSKIALSNNAVHVLDFVESKLERFSKKSSLLDTNTLVIYSSGQPPVNKIFEKETGITIVNKKLSSLEAWEDLKVKVLSGDSSFDIYILHSTFPNSHSLIKNGVFYDLSSSNILQNHIDSLFEVIKNNSHYNGKFFGLPISCSGDVMYYDEELLSQYNINADEIVTWEEFYETITIISSNSSAPHEFYANKNRIQFLVFNRYLYSYNDLYSGRTNFNTPQFKAALQYMKEANNSSYLQGPGDFSVIPLRENDVISINGVDAARPKRDTAFKPIPSITRDKDEKNNLSMSWLVINPKSKNKDLAIQYLETWVKNIDSRSPDYTLRESIGVEEGISAVWYSNYKSILSNSIMTYDYGIFDSVRHILEQFYLDAISVDEAAEKIDEKVRMIINE